MTHNEFNEMDSANNIVFWFCARCDEVTYQGALNGCQIISYIESSNIDEAFKKMVSLAHNKIPELKDKYIYIEECYECSEASNKVESIVDVVEIEWDE